MYGECYEKCIRLHFWECYRDCFQEHYWEVFMFLLLRSVVVEYFQEHYRECVWKHYKGPGAGGTFRSAFGSVMGAFSCTVRRLVLSFLVSVGRVL